MKIKYAVAALAIVCTIALAGSTLAAFTVTDTARNVVTASNLKVELSITADDGSGNTVDISQSEPIMPGDTADRVVAVKNTGAEPAWVRIKADITVNNETMMAADNPYVVFGDLDTTNWEWSDGYWYYNKPLDPGKTTEPLFKQVSFNPSIDSGLGGAELYLNVHTDAVQTANNGTAATNAQGW